MNEGKTEQDGKSSGESELPSNSRTIAATLGTNRSKLASDWLLDGAFNRSSTRGLFIRVLFEVVASVLRIFAPSCSNFTTVSISFSVKPLA